MPKTRRSAEDALKRLTAGFDHFHNTYFETNHSLYDELVRDGQSPRVMIIGCSDSRTDPALLTEAQPGDLFVVRNVAALVPPYGPDDRPKGTSAAIEFGVRGLEVEHIIVLGHALCGGIRALMEQDHSGSRRFEFLSTWVEIAAAARDAAAIAVTDAPPELRARMVEQAAIAISARNLMGFPWIAERVAEGRLAVHGWYFDLPRGELMALMPGDSRRFRSFRGALPEPAFAGTCPHCSPAPLAKTG
jgi:carbonic anhydrase